MSYRPILAAAALAAAAIVPAAASAHAELVSTTPKAGSAVPETTRVVTATFSEQIRSGTLVVRNASGVVVSIGSGGGDPKDVRRLRTTLKKNRQPGRFTVKYTVVAADGHRSAGGWAFRLR